MQAVLEARGVRVCRGGKTIVDGVDLGVARGERVVIEGPSGSGKSTLLRAIATLIPRDAGEVLLEGTSAEKLSAQEFRRAVSYVPQTPVMFPGTVAENLSKGPSLRREQPSEERLLSLLNEVKLDRSFLTREAATLSGGERQRVAIARSLANEPRVLLLDEPTAALDPETGLKLVELIRSLAEKGLTAVMVTHIAEHAQKFSGTRYLCDAGRLRKEAR